MMLKPLGKRVLIKLESNEKVSTGGLVLASAAKEKPTQGEVIALGQLVTDEDIVKAGDVVLFNEFSGTTITHEGTDYLVIDLEEVLAILG